VLWASWREDGQGEGGGGVAPYHSMRPRNPTPKQKEGGCVEDVEVQVMEV
jgi:hypothetical protein